MVLEKNVERILKIMQSLPEKERTARMARMKSGLAVNTVYSALGILVERERLRKIQVGNTQLFEIVDKVK
jgi:Fe2+ or Zn2+ uptake regulation protein